MTTAGTASRAASSWLALGVVAAAWVAQPGGPWAPAALASSSLHITGNAVNLTPGTTGSFALTAFNTAGETVVVRRIDVEVVDGGSPGCPARDLEATPWEGRLAIGAGASATVTASITVPARHECEGQTWTLRYLAE